MKSSNTPTCEEIEALLPAAAAGALDPDENTLVQAHVVGCERCLPLLTEYDGVIEQLAYAVPQVEPPPQVFERLMAAVAAPAAVAPAATPLPAAAPAPALSPAPPAAPPVLRPPAPTPPRRSLIEAIFGAYRQLAPAGLALALLALVLTAGWAASLNSRVAEQDHLIAMLRMPGSHAVALQPMTTTTTATGVAYMAPGHDEMGLMVSHLMPRPGRVYQVWLLMDDGRLLPCGTVEVDDMGVAMTRLDLPVDIARSRGIVITDEPPGPVVEPSGTKWLEADYR